MFGARAARQRRQAEAAERADAYSAWLLEEETVAEWRQHAEQVPVSHLLDDGNTLTVFRWPRRQIVAEKVLAAQQRLAFAQGALNERLGADTSPLWEFGWDICHDMFEINAKLIRQVFLKFEWGVVVIADPELRMEVSRRSTEQESVRNDVDNVAAALAEHRSGLYAPTPPAPWVGVEEERHCTVM